MNNMTRYVKIALFFIALGGAGGGYIILSSDGMNDLNTKVYEVVLQDATGLSTRSKVFLAGVAVGKVKAINLEGNTARVQIAFLKEVEIRNDAQISRKSSSILGTAVLALDPGTELSPLIPAGGRISSDAASGDMGALLGTVQDLGGQIAVILEEFQRNQMALFAVSLETFNSIARKIDAQSEAELERISRILESTALITEQTERMLREREGDISGSVEDIRGALENIRAITGEISRGQGNIGQAVYDDRLYETILSTVRKTEEAAVKLQEALDSVNQLSKNVDTVVASAGEIVDRAAGLGIQVDTNARYDLLAEQFRAGASLRLDPRSNDRWYRVGVNSAPDGMISQTRKDTYDANHDLIAREETSSAFSVDAELARRFGMLTIRGGLLESTAGLGLDFQPIQWLSLSGEVFNFKSGETPNLRGSLTFFPFFDPHSDKPWHWIYLRGGINDALNGNRDFFLGGGIRFSDREVKGLVGLVPIFGN
ncbi:hypothetical protein FACS189461_4720 [Spirochaetia bacterium]|nr:hypothetical protein FACS189461_4720 [Spirochaetia bacterium]